MALGETIYQVTSPLTWYDSGSPGGFGVVQIKRAFVRRADSLGISIDPKFNPENLTYGAQAAALCSSIQSSLGLTADGKCGGATMRAIFKPDLFKACSVAGISNELGCKLVSLESSFNPSAFNPAPYKSTYTNGTCDKGIVEKNGQPNDDTYWDVLKAFTYMANRLAAALDRYSGEEDVALASYNVGDGGAYYYKKAKDYVNLVESQTC